MAGHAALISAPGLFTVPRAPDCGTVFLSRTTLGAQRAEPYAREPFQCNAPDARQGAPRWFASVTNEANCFSQ